MAEHREPSHPPSDPHPALSRGSGPAVAEDRPVRAQLVAALLLGLVLAASGLYLWRRPHAPADGTASEAPSASAGEADGAAAAVEAVVDAGHPSSLQLSDPRVLACQDKGPHKTPAEQCDRLGSIEQALAHAIEENAACVPPAASGGTIEYVADVSFSRHGVRVTVPRAGRSVHDRKVVGACAGAVRDAMQAVALDGIDHQHARYKIAVTATYRSKT